MVRVEYIVTAPNGMLFQTTSYAHATKPGCRIIETHFSKVIDLDEDEAIDYLVKFWRKHR